MNEIKFNKEQILNSNQFTTIEKDILSVILKKDDYIIEEVKTILEDFKESEVE